MEGVAHDHVYRWDAAGRNRTGLPLAGRGRASRL